LRGPKPTGVAVPIEEEEEEDSLYSGFKNYEIFMKYKFV